jgi:ribonuclease HI
MPKGSEGQKIVVYTDGACSGNPGPGGWAWAVHRDRFETGAAPHTTNQRMEITAALQAVQALPGRLEVVSDSTYVVNCFNKRWYEAWLVNGWRNSQKKPVANRDLWEPFIQLVLARDVSFRWVKGHGTDAMNQLVDELAVLAAQAGKGHSSAALPLDRPRQLGATR